MQNEVNQVRPWAEVAGSEQFRALSPEHQERARELYYQDNVAPKVPKGMEQRARELFDQDTMIISQDIGLETPGQESNQSDGKSIITDAGNLLSGGVNRAAQNVRELVGRIPVVGEGILSAGDAVDSFIHGKDSETLLRENEKKYQGNLTRETQDAQEKLWWDSETKSLGPAWKDPRAYASGIIQSLPEMALTMGPSGRLAKAAYTRSLAKTGSKVMAAKAAAKTATIAGGIGEGLLGGADTARSVRDKINEMPLEKLANSEAFQSLIDEGMQPEEARRNLAEDSATQGMMIAGVATGIFGGLGDRALAKMLTGSIKGGVTSRVTKGAVSEGILEEFPQSMSQGLAENYAVQAADPTQELTEGVLNEGLGGLATGGVMGGGLGAMASPRTNQEPQPEPIDALETQEDATFENTPDPLSIEAPGLQGLLPAPEQTFYADSEGTVQDIGPVRSVDGVMRPAQQDRKWVNEGQAQEQAMPGGPGMDQQTPLGSTPGLEGQYQPAPRQQSQLPEAPGLMLDGEIERPALPAPDAIVVDSEGNAQRGATAPQVFDGSQGGGRGMDQQAPTAKRNNDQYETITKNNGQPYQTANAAKASKAFRDAKKAGRNPATKQVDGGFVIQVGKDPKRSQMRPESSEEFYKRAGQSDIADQPAQQEQAPKQQAVKTPEQQAQSIWDSMNTFERNAAAVNALGMRGVPAKNAATKAWDKLSSEQQAKLVTGLESQQGKRWIDPNQKVADQTGPVLQNRDRTSQDSIMQMRGISNNPDYNRLKTSGFLSDGAPVVINEKIQVPESQLGVTDTASAGDQKFNVQYAAVEADQLTTSNNIDGTVNPDYATGPDGKARAIAGNGRVTGLQSAWAKGNASQYKSDMAADRMHGIDPAVIEGMRNPILVRLLPQDQVTDNIGDLSNRDEKGRLSPVEQAKTDMGRIDLDSMKFTADGAIGGEAIHQFRMAQPAAERVSEAEARKRLTSAIFQKAYGNDQLTEIQSGESDDAKSIMSALAQAAPSMSRLEGAGEFDVRPLITQAGIAAVSAARRGTKLADYVQQSEMGIHPMVYPILEMMLNEHGNIRSSKYIGEQLTNMAKLAYDEANSPSSDMFGEKPKRTGEQVIQDALTGVQGYGQINDGRGQESLGQRGRSEPDAQMVEGPEGGRERPADTRQTAPTQPEAEQEQPAAVAPWGGRSFTLYVDEEYGPPPPHTKAYEAAKSAPKGSVTHGLTVRPSGKQWHNLYLSHGNGDFSSVSVGRDMPDNLTKLIEKGFSDYDKKQKKQEQAAKDKDAVSAKEAAIAKENNLVLGRELGTIIPNTGKQFKSAKIIADHGDGTFTLRGVQGNKQAELRGLSASSIVRAVDRYNLNAGTESEAWRKNYLLAKKRATELGLDPKEHGKLPGLVKAIDAATAEKDAGPALELEQQTEESRAEAERIEKARLEEEKKAQAKKARAEAKAKESANDRQAVESSMDRFELGQSAEQQLSGQEDIFGSQQDATPAKERAETKPTEKKGVQKESPTAARTELSIKAREYADSVRAKSKAFEGTYGKQSLKGLAVDFTEHAVENGRRMTDAEMEALATKYEIPTDVVEAISVNVFTFDGMLGDSERGNAGARALLKEAREIQTGKSADDGTRYSKTNKGEPQNLYVAHNLSADNLRYASKLGGLAAPSIAVGNIDVGAFNSFGEITLLAEPGMLESSKVRTFDADIYTPRHPQSEYQIDLKAYKVLADKVDKLPGELRFPSASEVAENGAKAFIYSDGAKMLYLDEQGKAPKAKPRKADAWIKKAAKMGLRKFQLAADPAFKKIAQTEVNRIYAALEEADPVVAERRARFYFDEGTKTISTGRLESMAGEVQTYTESSGVDEAQLRKDISAKLRTKKAEADFNAWADAQIEKLATGKKIYAGLTPSGNRKYIDYNLANIVKQMTRELQGGEGFNYGAGSVRSKYANEMKTVEAVKSRRDQIVSAEDFAKIKDESNKKLEDALEALKPYYRYGAEDFGYTNDASSAIAEGPSGIREAFDLDDKGRKIISDLVGYLRSMPTEYFEAKAGRAVDLSEFSYAVVPKGTPSDVLTILRENGIKVKRYDANSPASREEAIRSTNDILFLKESKEKSGNQKSTNDVKAEAITKAIADSPELAGVKVVQSFDDLPKSVRDRAKRDGVEPGDLRGIYSGGSTYVVADNHANVAEAVYTAVHEEVGHRGIRDMLGGKLTPTMERIYSSYAATAKGRKLIKDIREDYASVLKGMDAAKQRQVIAEELVAYAVQDGKRPTVIQRYISKVRELLRALFPQVSWTNTDILALGEQSRQWLRSAQDGTASSDSMYALRSKPKNTSEQFTDLTDKQKEALNKIAPVTTKQRAIDWIKEKSDRGLLKIRQGIVDRYASLRKLDEAVYGDDFLKTDITQSAWVLARMASSASGALHAMLNNGRIYLDPKQKVLDLQDGDALGLNATLARLGTPAEIERFMGWIAGNRSAKLATEGRENLFDAAEIEALRTLNRGTTEGNKDRGALYAEVFAEFQQYRDDVLAIAEQAGIITPENRAMWRDEFYVPFYRVMEEEKSTGPTPSKGLSRQEAYKKLKGGKQNLNDLLQNTVLNFNHLLAASMNNQAAAQALDNAAELGIATPTSESARDTKASTYVLKDGVKQWYNIDDPLVFEALNAISDAGLNGAAIKAMSFLKRMFTNAITVTPQFIVANLLRDAMSATATSPVSKNFMKNIVTGGMAWTDSRQRARMLASGGAFSFGHIYSNDPHEMKAHLTRNLRSANIMDGTKLIPQALKAGWDHWNALATAAENSNRTAIFQQSEQRDGKLSAAFEARDLTDFSAHGAWPAMRFLIRVIPFLNARIQGNDKLYRSGLKPAVLTAFSKGTTSDKQAAKRFLAVTTAISMASMALMLVNNDDEEYRRLEEWQKDTYWFVRVGSKAFFIPKPFEVGTIATMTERLLQQAIDDKATGELFRQRVGHALTETFSFSVVPHAFQPLLEVYANQDSFTQRPIESMGMERLSKGLRSRASTTAPAKLLSKASLVLGDDFPLAVSPVQADHLIAGYFGQVGTWGAGIADTIWRSANGETEPAKHWHEYQPIRRFYKDLDVPSAYTRYSTLFYEGLREAGKAYADVQELQKIDRMDDARKVVDEKRDVLQMRTQLNKVQRQLTKINNRMNMIRISKIDSDSKRRELDRLTVIKARLTEQAGKQVEEMKAKR